MHSAHSSVRSGMCSPLRASLSLFPSASSPGGRRIQAGCPTRRVPHTRRFRRKHLRSLDASSPRSFTCPLLHGLTLETALTRSLPNLRRLLRRLPIRPVAQTDGSFGQASLQGTETSGNVLNRSLRCFLPRAAFDPRAGAHRLVNSPNTKTCLCCPPGKPSLWIPNREPFP